MSTIIKIQRDPKLLNVAHINNESNTIRLSVQIGEDLDGFLKGRDTIYAKASFTKKNDDFSIVALVKKQDW